ncbi:hypothetical protein [Actinomadura rudentiformis]|uniref:Uncharacterized protein n=1 Tax=Actinomadura rudentiformis TaxID=359158 RepID=A0A6H9Z1X7_9ACTN|nr:hypothetical protein [Actinomadura rudentiformis]KAB2347267.1 hypothetical protein F8566_19795 [Actinomadura rudentiformis]
MSTPRPRPHLAASDSHLRALICTMPLGHVWRPGWGAGRAGVPAGPGCRPGWVAFGQGVPIGLEVPAGLGWRSG